MKKRKELINENEVQDRLLFKKLDGTVIENVHEYVKAWVKNNEYGTVTIGSDSQEHSRYIKYATTIIMHSKDRYGVGHGGHVIVSVFKDFSKNMKSDVYTKLWAETEVTIDVAKMVGNIGKKITIHLDYNSDESKYSNVLYNSGIGYANSLGFEAFGKPYAWCSSHIADKFAKK